MSKKVKTSVLTPLIRHHMRCEPVSVTYTDGDNDVALMVTPHISLEAQCQLINGAAQMCCPNGVYQPGLYRLAWGYQVLHAYTNLTLPGKVEPVWALISRTGLLQAVTEAVQDDLAVLQQSLREEVDMRRSRSKWEEVADGLAGMLSKLKELDSQQLAETVKAGMSAGGNVLPFPAANREKES